MQITEFIEPLQFWNQKTTWAIVIGQLPEDACNKTGLVTPKEKGLLTDSKRVLIG